MADGFNPMRWDCEKRGCFNKKQRPKIEIFHDLFPGSISFGDVDGIVEINKHALILEWKSCRKSIPEGQKLMYKRLAATGKIVALVVFGDAESMSVDSIAIIDPIGFTPPFTADMNEVRRIIAAWVEMAQANDVKKLWWKQMNAGK